ncbi:unnamed protein product [Brachionus calyciflorus]|uniref:DNA-directed RNA polymerase I subunit RPA12 n=1 Tax=Brachionus calyciflorus TaxID=104777 RepID=A0A813YWR9_9BILA|nr:unnamed protein product [Brachionus calyciflorus]
MEDNLISRNSSDCEMEQENVRFEVNDLEFCFTCGTILPLPSLEDHLMCRLCKKTIKINQWNGKTLKNVYLINASEYLNETVKHTGLKSEDFMGTLVDRKCSKCGHEGMTYSTRQTRSADEGQTVFYGCPKCKSQEIEHS